MLPTMILNYEKPNELCVKASEAYCKVIRDQVKVLEEQKRPTIQQQTIHQGSIQQLSVKSGKIEHLKNLGSIIIWPYMRRFRNKIKIFIIFI